MAAKKASTATRIKAEKKRLLALLADIGDERLRGVDKLIDRAAFYAVTLEDLEAVIAVDGPVSEYQNGANQFGTKRSPEADLHIAMTKNLLAVMKQLIDLLPEEVRPSKGDALKDFIERR